MKQKFFVCIIALVMPFSLCAEAQTTFWWTNNASGGWSAGGNWSNSAPLSATGSNDYAIIFQNATTAVTSTNDFGPFTLNRLVFDASSRAVTLVGSALVFSASSAGVNPSLVFNNNTTGYTINNALVLSNDLTALGAVAIGGGAGNLNGSISGSGALIQAGNVALGANTFLTLNAANSYTGGTRIYAGRFSLGNTAATLGTGDVLVAPNGQLYFNAAAVVSNNFTIIGTGSDADGVLRLGTGTLKGTVTLLGDSLTAPNNGTTGTNAANITGVGNLTRASSAANGVLAFTGNNNFQGNFILGNSGNAAINYITGSNSFAGGLYNNGVLTTTILTGTNTYTGGTFINGGAVIFGSTNAMPATGSILVNGGAIGLYSANVIDTITNRVAQITGIAGGSVALTASNASENIDFSSPFFANAYLGAYGTVTNTGVYTPNQAGVWRFGGGGGTLIVTNQLTSGSLVIGGGSGGTVTLTASNSFSGGTIISNNILRLSNKDALGTGTNIVLQTPTWSNELQLNSGSSGNWIITNQTLITDNLGTGNAPTLRNVNGTNTWGGTIITRGTGAYGVQLQSDANLLIVSANITNVNVPAGSAAVFIRGNAYGILSGNLNLGLAQLRKGDGGTWQINSTGNVWANSYIENGKIVLGTNDALAVMSYLTHGGSVVTIDLNGFNQTLLGLSSTRIDCVITNSSATTPSTLTISNTTATAYSYSSAIKGNVSVVMAAGAQTLTATNTFTGGLNINGGDLVLAGTNTVPTGSITNNSATGGIGLSTPVGQGFLAWVTNNVAGTVPGAIVLGAASSSNLNFSGVLANTFLGAAGGPFAYTGLATWPDNNLRLGNSVGTLTFGATIGSGTNLIIGAVGGPMLSVAALTANNTNFNGTVTINSGALNLQANYALGTNLANTLTVPAGATLQVQGSITTVAQSLTLTGMGLTNEGALHFISGNNNFSNNITLATDTRIVSDAGNQIIYGNVTNAGNHLFVSGGTGYLQISGVITGTGGLVKDGSGYVTLAGVNTYLGPTTISNGALRISGAMTALGTNFLNIVNGVLELNNLTFTRTPGTSGSNTVQITGQSGFGCGGNNATISLWNSTTALLTWGTNGFAPDILVLQGPTSSGNTLTFNNPINLIGTNRAIDVRSATGTGAASLAGYITNSIGNNVGIIKGGPGVLQLQGVNTYTGPTVVTGGVLRLSGVSALPPSNLILSNGVLEAALADFTRAIGTDTNQVQLPAGFSGFSAQAGLRTINLGGSNAVLTLGTAAFNPAVLVLNESSANHNLIFANGLDLAGSNLAIAAGNYNAFLTGPVTNTTGISSLTFRLPASGNAGTLVILTNNFNHNGSTIVSNGATIQLGDYWANTAPLPGLAGNSGNLSNNGTVIIANLGNQTLSGIISGTGALTKNSLGTLTLTGTNTYTGRTTVNRGTLTLDFSASGAPANHILPAAAPLTLGGGSIGGGTLFLLGKDTTTNVQTIGGLTISSGANKLILQNGTAGGVNLALGALTRANNNGGILDFTPPATGFAITTTYNNFTGILGGYFTVNGADWATAANGGFVAAYTGYTPASATIANSSNLNVKITGDVNLAAATTAINTLVATNDATLHTVTLGNQTLRLGTTGGLLVPAGSGGLTIGASVNDGYLTAGTGANVAGELIVINNSASNVTINSAIINNGTAVTTLTKAGPGPAIFAGTNYFGGQLYITDGLATFTNTNTFNANVNIIGGAMTLANTSTNTIIGQMTVNRGTLTINGPVTIPTSNFEVGNVAGARAVVYLNSNFTLGTGRLRVGTNTDNLRSAGAVFQTGGFYSGGAGTFALMLSDGINNYGYYNMSGGIVSNSDVAVGWRGISVFDLINGSVTPAGNFNIAGSNGGQAEFNIFGGTLNAPLVGNANLKLASAANSGSYALFNVLGGTVNAAYNGTAQALDLMNGANNTGIVNLNGGTLIANQIRAGNTGTSIFNFNGGLLRVGTNTTLGGTFFTGLAATYVYPGGALIDTYTNTATIGQQLLAPTGLGLTNITLASTGAGFIGNPLIRISGGSGTGATAIALVDFANGGVITNIIITSPGVGYQPGDQLTIAILGGGPTNTATVSGYSFATNTSGGLTKLGTGTLNLSGTNTYTGGTVINTGMLQLGAGGASGSVLGAITNYATLGFNRTDTNISPNLIIGTGSVAQNGTGITILTNANNSYSGGTILAAGTLGLGNDNVIGSGALTFTNGTLAAINADRTVTNNVLFAGNGTIGAGSNVTLTGTVDLGASNRVFTINNALTTVTGVISNTGSLTKAGPGLLVLTATNAYTGSTLVNGGMLRADWGVGVPATSAVTLSNGIWETGAPITNTVAITGGAAGFSAYGNPVTVNLGNAGATLPWGTNFFNPTTFVLNTNTATSPLTLANPIDLNGGKRTIAVYSNTACLAAGLTNTVTGAGLVKTGWGTLVVSNQGTLVLDNNNAGVLTINQGTLVLASGVISSAVNQADYVGNNTGDSGTLVLAGASQYRRTPNMNSLTLGNNTGSRGTMLIQDDAVVSLPTGDQFVVANNGTGVVYFTGGTITAGADTRIGSGAGSVGAFYQTGGSYSGTGDFDLSYGNATGYGFYLMAGGSLSNNGLVQAARYGLGVLYQNAGSITITANGLIIGDNAGTGVVYQTGGLITGNQPIYMSRGANNSRAELTLTNTAVIALNNDIQFNSNNGTGNNFLNLNGGLLQINRLYKSITGAVSFINFNGGTLKAGVAGTLFGPGAGGVGPADAAYVWPGNAIIDVTNLAITISQNLLAPTGQGVTSLPWGGTISNYVGAPYVSITGGGGTGATAVALFDYTSGIVTGLVITSPGVQYTSPPTVTLIGGGNTNLVLGTATLGANASGGLTKLGAGSLTLTGTNTFTGGINVSNGLLIGTTFSLLGGITNSGGGVIFDQTFAGTFNGAITGNGFLGKQNTGLVILTNVNSYSGNTIITGGVLRADYGVGIPATGNTIILSNGVWESGQDITLPTTQVQLPGGVSGFSAYGNPITVNLGGAGATLVWGVDLNPSTLVLNAATANTNLTFANPLDFGSLTRTVAVNAAAATLTGVLTNGGLAKAGPGTLLLTATNTYAGGTVLNAGTLSVAFLANVGTPCNLGVSNFTFTGGALQYTGSDITIDRIFTMNANGTLDVVSANLTDSAAMAGNNTYTLAKTGAGTFTITGTGDNNAFWVGVSNGVVVLAKSSAGNVHAVAGIRYVANGATLQLDGTGGDQIYGGALGCGITNLVGTLDMNGRSEAISLFHGSGLVTNTTTTNVTFTVGQSSDTGNFSGAIGGNLNLVKAGSNTLVLSGASTYTGPTTVNGGTLDVRHSAALGQSAGVTIATNGTVVQLNGGITITGIPLTNFANGVGVQGLQSINGTNTWTGPITLGADQVRFGVASGSVLILGGIIDSGSSNFGFQVRSPDASGVLILMTNSVYKGNSYLTIGTIQLGTDNALPPTSPLYTGNATPGDVAILDLAGYNQQVAGLYNNAGSVYGVITNTAVPLSTFTVSNQAANTCLGALGGNLGLTKLGNGKLTLCATNTYTGPTLIAAGTLALAPTATLASTSITLSNGANLDVSAIAGGLTIQSGQTFSGNGTNLGELTIASGATLAPGASIGTLTFSTNLTLQGTTLMELNRTATPSNDFIQVLGVLSYGGILTVTNLGDPLAQGDTFQLFGGFTSWQNAFSATNLPDLSYDPTLAWDTADLYNWGRITVIPEPNTLTLVALGLAGALLLRRRRTQS